LSATASDVESTLAENVSLKDQNEALKKLVTSLDGFVKKLKDDLKKSGDEMGAVLAENGKLQSDLVDANRLTELLREQVSLPLI